MVPTRRIFYLLLPLLAGPLFLAAQATPEVALIRLFDRMRAADTTGLRDLFHPAATFNSVVTRPDGKEEVRAGRIEAFIAGIGGAATGDLDEQLHYTELRTDGRLATAWTPYTFVYRGEVSHCGTNAFQLVATEGIWQILHVTDTRYRDDCARPDPTPPVDRITALADDWHRAAARADSAAFFGSMTKDAIYIGTDAGEHWTKEEFLGFAAPYFARGEAWDFTATERHVFYDPSENVAYWDELLTTWMGPCRGTAVVRRDARGAWKIAHYTLSVTVPNEKIEGFLELTKPD